MCSGVHRCRGSARRVPAPTTTASAQALSSPMTNRWSSALGLPATMAASDVSTRSQWTGAQLDALAEALLPAGGTGMPSPAGVGAGRRAPEILNGLPSLLPRLGGPE